MAKRTNIRRRGKAWVVYFRANGRQVWRSFPTREAAELYLAQVQVEKARGELRAPTRVTFGEALDERLRHGEHERGLKPSTVRDYKSCAERWLRPAFGDLRLEAVTAPLIERWRAEAMARPKSPLPRRQADKLVAILHGVFERARRAYGFPRNPVDDVERLKVSYSGRFDFYSPEEVHALARATASEQDGLFPRRRFHRAQARRACALRVRDLDSRPRRSASRVDRHDGRARHSEVGRTRSVPMVPEAAQALRVCSAVTTNRRRRPGVRRRGRRLPRRVGAAPPLQGAQKRPSSGRSASTISGTRSAASPRGRPRAAASCRSGWATPT